MSHILIAPAAVLALRAFAEAVEKAASETPWCGDEILSHTRGLAAHLEADATGWVPGHLVHNALVRFASLPEGHEAKTDAIKALWQSAVDAVEAKADGPAPATAPATAATDAPAASTPPADATKAAAPAAAPTTPAAPASPAPAPAAPAPPKAS